MYAWIAQLVEHSPEEGGVSSSSLLPSTKDRPESENFRVVVFCSLEASSNLSRGEARRPLAEDRDETGRANEIFWSLRTKYP
jgi:hypothetical protein